MISNFGNGGHSESVRPRSGEHPRSQSNAALLPFLGSGSLPSATTSGSALYTDQQHLSPRGLSNQNNILKGGTLRGNGRPLEEIPPDPELLSSLYALVHSLPQLNRDLLLYLLNFFHEVTLKSDKNRANALSLAIAISNCFFRRAEIENTTMNLASTAQLEEARAQKEKFERSLLLTNSVTAMLIANAPVLQEVSLEALNKQAEEILTSRERLHWSWSEWSWKLVSWSWPKFRECFLESNALERSLQRAASGDITYAEGEVFCDLLNALLREPPSNVSVSESAIISAQAELDRLPTPADDAEVAHVIAVEVRRVELLYSLQASRAALIMSLAADYKQLVTQIECLKRSANTLTLFHNFYASSSGTVWHRLAQQHKLPQILLNSEYLTSWERRKDPLETWMREAKRAYLDSVAKYASERQARLAQLNFTRKKVQALLKGGGGSAQTDQMRERFMRLRDPLTKSYPAVVETLLKLGADLAPMFESRVLDLQAELFKLEALVADIGRTTL